MRTKWGQNFLTDKNWQKKIVDLFQPTATFGEIGPGRGALTQHLSKKYDFFYVFEIDPSLFSLHENRSYQLIKGDFLDWDYKINEEPIKKFSLIGNLPYETGTAMLSQIVKHADQIEGFLFLLQKEVVDRVVARPSTSARGYMSLWVQSQFEVKALDKVPPGAFSPPPKVESQLLLGKRRASRLGPSEAFEDFLKLIFSNRRKTLKNNLKSTYSDSPNLERVEIDLGRRAESLEREEALRLFSTLENGED